MEARGIRNCNPLNIRRGKSLWLGMCQKQTDKCFVQFTSRIYGYRAAFVLLSRYIERGTNTIGKIVARWAPSTDGNNTQAYIGFVAETAGIGASETITFGEREKLVEIVRSMAQMESGVIEDKAMIEQAYEMAKQ